ncbi:MAG: bifunctional histidine phosphatase family protein/GNAT family N-acetyltransferase [Lawsonibacter sp.]|nr:bifunctional histidine phosphatase family protein/GNAT family N-acetyltransferase [Lawsonibacter sp.]
MTTIYLIRHAEAEGNLHRRIHGWYDALVTENGFCQIEALQQRFRDIPVTAVWSSDLYRTKATARAIYLPKGLELHIDPELREINMGDWEDQTWGEVRHFDPVGMAQFNHSDPTWHAPNGENLADVGSRGERAIRRIAQAYPDQAVAIFSHGTVIRQILANIMGIAPEDWHTLGHSENTAVNLLTYDSGHFEVLLEGDASHLDCSLCTLGRQTWWRKDRKAEDVNLWFRPIDWGKENGLYLDARHEAWISTHVNGPQFQAEGFLLDAQEHLSRSPFGVTVAMAGDEVAGLLQLDTQRYSQDGAGYIPFCYIAPERRDQSLGIQLIGQAVSFFRPLGRNRLRLRCAPYNNRAQHFYAKYGFVKIGEEPGSRIPLDILEKYIGYDR